MNEAKTFENLLVRLEDITKDMNDENISLEKSLELFKEGVKVAQDARDILDNAKLQIQNFTQDNSNNE